VVMNSQEAVEAVEAVDYWRRQEEPALTRIDAYLRGEHDKPYQPKSAHTEYNRLADRRISNYLPLVVDTIAQDLYVEGYRLPDDPNNAGPWRQWQLNNMDSRQLGLHRASVAFGVSFTIVLPGAPGTSVIRCKSPRQLTVVYEDTTDDEWPIWAGQAGSYTRGSGKVLTYKLYDDTAVYTLETEPDSDKYILRDVRVHGLGVTPVSRYLNRNDLSGQALSAIEPLFPIQDRINETTFGLLMAQNYASFRQRWVTGLDIPVDPKTKEPIEPFQAAVDRVWHTDDPNAKFGEFGQTDLSGYLASREASIRDMAAIAQIPPQSLSVPISNLSAEALALIQSGHDRSILEHKSLFGESHKATLRLAALASGDAVSADETEGRVIWRDTQATSFAAMVDGLGKLGTMLNVPVQALWERIPGVTTTDVEEWRRMAEEADVMGRLDATLNRQAAELPIVADENTL
jgi:hypothetical protein